jgi:hypothetical protein
MLTRMSDPPNSSSRARPSADGSIDGAGVLASLPRTRPQRASARRGAARAARARKAPAGSRSPAGKAPTKQTRAKQVRAKRVRPSEPTIASVPMQGYEAEESLSRPIQPPGGAELVVSVAELAGELARAGVSTGARLLKDLFSRVPPG